MKRADPAAERRERLKRATNDQLWNELHAIRARLPGIDPRRAVITRISVGLTEGQAWARDEAIGVVEGEEKEA